MPLPWPVRGVLAGVAATAVMTLSYEAERRIRHSRRPLDYDDSEVPGEIVASILDLHGLTSKEELELGEWLRWTYGSAFGVWHVALRHVLPEPQATVAFGTTLLGITFTAFPVLGRTPPPWRWPPDVLATAVGTHVAYAVTAGFVDDALAPHGRSARRAAARGAVRATSAGR